MKYYVLPLLAMALSSPAYAQDAASGPWDGFYVGLQVDALPDSEFSVDAFPTVTGEIEGVNAGIFMGYRRQ